jgi:hypothetical protein
MKTQLPHDKDHSTDLVCESCGARHCVLQKDGRYVCQSCGWVQRQHNDPSHDDSPPKKRRAWLIVPLLIMIVSGVFGWRHMQRTAPAAVVRTAATPPSAPASAGSSVSDAGNRQITIQDPKVRVIDKNADWTLAELLAPALPLFDTSKLELGSFEKIADERGPPTFRALLTNHSTDTVVIRPAMGLLLFSTDGTSQIPFRIDGLPPMLYPGEKAWIKVGDQEDIKPIARVEVTWHPSRAVPLPGPRRLANIEVKSNHLHDCYERRINHQGEFTGIRFDLQCVEMHGVIRNTDTRKMQLLEVTAFYYDSAGRYVGSGSNDLNVTLNPGEQTTYGMDTRLLRNHGYARYELHYYNQ